MREIKFRFWRDSRMQKAIQLNSYINTDGNFFGDDEILMQFSGVYDKNGKEIYENDIVRFVLNKDIRTETVWFYSGSFNLGSCIDLRRTQIDEFIEVRNSLEVIGNIHENPELLS